MRDRPLDVAGLVQNDFAMAMAMSPVGLDIIGSTGSAALAWAAIPLLLLLQVLLVLCEHRRLDQAGADRSTLPPLSGSLFPPAYLARRGDMLGRGQEFTPIWFGMLCVCMVPVLNLSHSASSIKGKSAPGVDSVGAAADHSDPGASAPEVYVGGAFRITDAAAAPFGGGGHPTGMTDHRAGHRLQAPARRSERGP